MISDKAIIEKNAFIDPSATVGPFSIIGKEVKIGKNVRVSSHVVITGDTSISEGCEIFPFSSIGTHPQDLKFKGEKTKLIIGKNNKIREYVTINPGTEHGGGLTKIGDNCLFMISSHIAHDCKIGNNVILANNVAIAGHVEIEDNVIIGGNSAVQQFTRIGRMAMIGGMTGVEKDIIPYGLAIGNRSHLEGINLIGLKRAGYSSEEINALNQSVKLIFSNNLLKDGIEEAKKFSKFKAVKDIISFLEKSEKRPICRPLR
jgi:UDP-N-acetylglucosamine acyltransferase